MDATDSKTIGLWCTGCRGRRDHVFVGMHEGGLIRYRCKCGRVKLLTTKEQRA